jgi:hypothetical protein
MTEKPWCLADLGFEPMGDDLREKATINGVEIVREDGRYWNRTENGPHYDNLAEDGVDGGIHDARSRTAHTWTVPHSSNGRATAATTPVWSQNPPHPRRCSPARMAILMSSLILTRASVSRPSGQWRDDD